MRAASRSREAVPPAKEVGALLKMVEDSKVSLNAAKTAFAAMCTSGKGAEATVGELGLAQVSDEGAIAAACDKVIASEPDKLAEYRGGRDKLFGFFVGQVMKAMGGKANPKVINDILKAETRRLIAHSFLSEVRTQRQFCHPDASAARLKDLET